MTTNTKLNAATRILVDEHGKKIRVDHGIYNAARSAYKEGSSATMVQVGQKFYYIDLEQNFKDEN